MSWIVDTHSTEDLVIIKPNHIITHLTTFQHLKGTYGIQKEMLIMCWALNRGWGNHISEDKYQKTMEYCIPQTSEWYNTEDSKFWSLLSWKKYLCKFMDNNSNILFTPPRSLPITPQKIEVAVELSDLVQLSVGFTKWKTCYNIILPSGWYWLETRKRHQFLLHAIPNLC